MDYVEDNEEVGVMPVKKKLAVFDKIVLFLNALSAIALLLSYLSSSTDPRDSSLIALLGFGYQVLVAVNLVFVVYWLLRLRMLVLVSMLSVLLGISPLRKTFGFRNNLSPGNTKEQPGAIRLMQYNVRAFDGLTRYKTRTYKDVLQVIKDKQPDVIALEEYVLRKRDGINMTDSIIESLNSSFHYFKTFRVSSFDSSGVAIFSKFPIIDSGTVQAPEAVQMHAAFVDVKYENGVFRVYCIHLAAVEINADDKAQMLNGDLRLNEASFIRGKLVSAFLMRSYQVPYIKESLEKCPYPYIIMGDFNDTPNSYAVNTLGEGLKSAFTEKGCGLGVTYYNKFPKLQIDHILVSPQFEVLNYEAIDRKISDHKPVLSDVFFHVH